MWKIYIFYPVSLILFIFNQVTIGTIFFIYLSNRIFFYKIFIILTIEKDIDSPFQKKPIKNLFEY